MIRVSVVAALPERQEVVSLELPEGSCAAEAVAASGLLERYPQLAGASIGVWSRKVDAALRLRDGDRVELYRPLIADAKESRRARARGPR